MSRRQYKKPPIAEALCELRFDPTEGPGWDAIRTPALLLEAFQDHYPGEPQIQNLAGVTQAESSFTMSQTTRIQFRDLAALRLVSVAPNLLSVHMLQPYSGWEDFQRQINHALNIYCNICRRSKLTRIGLRYINRIPIPASIDTIQAFFQCTPPPMVVPGMSPIGVLQRTEHLYEDGVRLAVTFATLAPEQGVPDPGHGLYLLDLDLIWQAQTPTELGSAMPIIDDLHTKECEAFEASITDQLRGVIG
jgi:uncharacterized protein (TIGR04255 family)